MDASIAFEDCGVESATVLDVSADLIGRMQLLDTATLDQSFRDAWSIRTRFPVLQLDDHCAGAFRVATQEHDIAPRGRPWELIFESNMMFPLREVNVKAIECRARQRFGQSRQ